MNREDAIKLATDEALESPEVQAMVRAIVQDTLEGDFPEIASKESAIKDNLTTLNLINYQVAELLRIKEELEARVSALFEHGDDGSKTYLADKYKVTITSGWNYTLNKSEYQIMGSRLPACFQPVRERIAYDLDKQVIRDAEKYASAEELELLAQMISKKPKKLHVSIKAGI